MGRGDGSRIIHLLPLYRSLGENHVGALLGFHSLSGYDITGRIFGKSKTTFMRCSDNILTALGDLGRNAEPSVEVLDMVKNLYVKFSDRETVISLKLHISGGFISVALVKTKVLTSFIKVIFINTYGGHITNVPSGCRH